MSSFWGKRGMSLEWVWRFSKLSPNSLQTRSKLKWFHFFCCYFLFLFIYIFGQEEWVWSGFGDSPNSLQTLSKLSPSSYVFLKLLFYFFLWKRGMSLEWLWRFSKFSPNSLQTHPKLAPNSKDFMFFYFTLFFGKEEWVSLQTHVFFCYVTTEKTASPGSPAKLSS